MARAIRFLLSFILVVVLAGWISRVAAPPLPAFEVMASCDPRARQDDMAGFIDFARRHDGEIAYVRFGLKASDHAGSCEIEKVADSTGDPAPGPRLGAPESGSGFARDGYPLVLSGLRDGKVIGVALPDPRAMPPARAYVRQKDWFRYYAAGLFVLRHDGGNGFEGASLYPAESSTTLAAGISCAKRRLDWDPQLAGLLPCF